MTESGDLNRARGMTRGAGTQTAGLGVAGYHDPETFGAIVESYDGSSWTEIADLSVGRQNHGAAGTTTATLAFGGYVGPPGYITTTEQFDGSAWSTAPAMPAARGHLASLGTQALALGAGGTPPITNATIEFTGETSAAEASDISFD